MTKSIIFDLGAVMVDWNPNLIAKNFTTNTELQDHIVKKLFTHQNWLDFDNGLITELQLIGLSSQLLNLSELDVSDLISQAKESLNAKTELVDLLQLAKNNGLNTYCLSNLSHEWFTYLTDRHDFFSLFDGKVISAQEGISKPNPAIFERLIERYSINPNHSLFIDDRIDNTQSAENIGFKTVTFEHSEHNLKTIKNFIDMI